MIIPFARLANERWFGAESRNSEGELRLFDLVSFPIDERSGLRLTFAIFDAVEERYFLPLLGVRPGKPTDLGEKIKDFRSFLYYGGYEYFDALIFPEYAASLNNLLQKCGEFSGERGRGKFVFSKFTEGSALKTRYIKESSNSLLCTEQQVIYKHYRRLFSGEHPEASLGETEIAENMRIIPCFYGKAEYLCGGNRYALILSEEFLKSSGTAWELAEKPSSFLQIMREIGKTVAELHCFLGNGTEAPLDSSELIQRFQKISEKYKLNLQIFATSLFLGKKIRLHGDLHLEQLLLTADGWRIIDFEGEPTKPFLERDLWGSPLQDLASLCSSIAYRVATAYLTSTLADEGWQAFLESYCSCERLKPYLPEATVFNKLLKFFRIERALYELEYERNYRPNMQDIPRKILNELLEHEQ